MKYFLILVSLFIYSLAAMADSQVEVLSVQTSVVNFSTNSCRCQLENETSYLRCDTVRTLQPGTRIIASGETKRLSCNYTDSDIPRWQFWRSREDHRSHSAEKIFYVDNGVMVSGYRYSNPTRNAHTGFPCSCTDLDGDGQFGVINPRNNHVVQANVGTQSECEERVGEIPSCQ